MKFNSTYIPHIRNLNTKRKRRPRRHRKWQKFYSNKLWKQLREQKLNDQPICEICLMSGIITPATEVHHLEFISWFDTEEERWKKFLDYNNLMSLCHNCHQTIHSNTK